MSEARGPRAQLWDRREGAAEPRCGRAPRARPGRRPPCVSPGRGSDGRPALAPGSRVRPFAARREPLGRPALAGSSGRGRPGPSFVPPPPGQTRRLGAPSPTFPWSRAQRLDSACLQSRDAPPQQRLPVVASSTSRSAAPAAQFTLKWDALPGRRASAPLTPVGTGGGTGLSAPGRVCADGSAAGRRRRLQPSARSAPMPTAGTVFLPFNPGDFYFKAVS